MELSVDGKEIGSSIGCTEGRFNKDGRNTKDKVAITIAIAATAHGRSVRLRLFGMAFATTELPSQIQTSSSCKSQKVCQRSSTFFARHFLMTRSRAGGTSLTNSEIGMG